MEICPRDKCAACAACVAICPSHAIDLVENPFGELHAVVNDNLCHHCGLCHDICPANGSLSYLTPQQCYAAWITDMPKRAKCASGGIATALAEYVVDRLHGKVYGTAYDNTMLPRISLVDTHRGIECLKGSKYVQSIPSKILYRNLKSLLKDNTVVFFGTPCQIAGVKSYLRTDYKNLITVDLICHGTSPTSYFKQEIEELKRTLDLGAISDIRFRGNDDDNSNLSLLNRLLGNYNSNNFRLSVWRKTPSGNAELLYRGDQTENYYLAGFLLGITLRENCYSCKYARPERIADITLGDFINIGKEKKFQYPVSNISIVLINTKKGELFFNDLLKYDNSIVAIERDYNERLSYPYSLVVPFPRHPLQTKFRQLYLKYGWVCAIRKTLGFLLFVNRIKKRLLHFARLPGYAIDKVRSRLVR